MSFWNDKNISAAYRLAKAGTSDSGIAAQSQSKTTTMMRFPPAPRYPSRFPANLSEDDTDTFREVSPNSHRDHDDNHTNVDFRSLGVQTEDLKAQVTSSGAPQQPPPQPNVGPSPYQPQLPSPSQYQPQFPSPGPNPGNYRARPGPPGRMGPRPIRQGPPAPRGPKMGYGYRYSPCFRCGGAHVPSSCPYLQYQCHTCSSVGHLAKMCPQAAPKGQ